MAIKGASVAYCVVGGLILFSGIKGATISDTIKQALKGNLNVTPTENIQSGVTGSAAAGDTSAANPTAAENQALAKTLAVQMGHSDWTTGQAWDDWLSLWNRESGWSITAANPHSDARGIAQKITGYSSDYLEGNATSQITWGINYIAQRYTSPVLAWQFELANGYY